MVTFSVVVLDPWCKCSCALLVAGDDLTIGPFGGEGAVESFDLSVLPRAVRTNELLNSAQRCADILQVGGVAVRKRVVGQDPLDAADAFALYESVRIPRTARIVWSTREMGRVYHAAGVERQVRNLLWKDKSLAEFYRGMEWLYGWKEDNCLLPR